jgi:hypothetical protein
MFLLLFAALLPVLSVAPGTHGSVSFQIGLIYKEKWRNNIRIWYQKDK